MIERPVIKIETEEKMTPPRPAPTPPLVIDPAPNRRRLIDVSMPLPWIIGMFFSVVSGLLYIGWMAANQNNKLTQIVDSQVKMEAKQEAISTRADVMRDQFAELKPKRLLLFAWVPWKGMVRRNELRKTCRTTNHR
jgi:hypothetical protein